MTMAKTNEQYEWRENLACVATYKILESDKFLDQFEDADIPFNKAGSVKLGKLRYYPKTTQNADIIEMLALEIARKFLTYVSKMYTITKQDSQKTSAGIIQAVADVFVDSQKTIAELAGVVDDNIKFPDED